MADQGRAAFTQSQINAKQIGDLSQSVAEKGKEINQVDYVKLLQEHNEVAAKIFAKITGNKKLEVLVPFKGEKVARFAFDKDLQDDYIKLNYGQVGKVGQTEAAKEKVTYDSTTGVYTKTNPPNFFTTEVGATITKQFNGTGLDWFSYTDNRGGIWEFVVDGNTNTKKQISVNSVTLGKTGPVTQQLFRGLTQGPHTVVGTFKGSDPVNAPAGGVAARGWVWDNTTTSAGFETFSGEKSFTIYDLGLNYSNLIDVLVDKSNKDFAISMRPYESQEAYQFFPEHSGVPTAFLGTQKVYFDDVEITNWTIDAQLREVKSVKLVQKMIGKFPNQLDNPLCEIYSIQTVNAKGASLKFTFKFLRKVSIQNGYAMMFPFYTSFGKVLITSTGKRYLSKYEGVRTQTNLDEKDMPISYAVINTGGQNGETDIIAAMTIQNPNKTLRRGKNDRPTFPLWLEHRDGTMNKLYPQIFENSTIEAGEVLEGGGTFFIGEFPFANEMI